MTLDWYPVGTGPSCCSENNPNLRMVLTRNPNFHGELYPSEGMPGDAEPGFSPTRQPLPFIDAPSIAWRRKNSLLEQIPPGYYDSSGISSDAFDQAVQIDAQGEPILTDAMREQGIPLLTSVEPSIFYLGFNMLDPVVGGDSQRARLLRRAISIAVDYEEFISIFANGRGVVAQGPIPPGIFGHREGEAGINPFVYEWRDGRPVRRSLDEARVLMEQAGYPGGIERETGRTLTINYEAVATGPDDRARLNWIRKQFAKLGIDLVSAPPTTTAFRINCATAPARSSCLAGTRTIRTPRISSSCCMDPMARSSIRARTPPIMPIPSSIACSMR